MPASRSSIPSAIGGTFGANNVVLEDDKRGKVSRLPAAPPMRGIK